MLKTEREKSKKCSTDNETLATAFQTIVGQTNVTIDAKEKVEKNLAELQAFKVIAEKLIAKMSFDRQHLIQELGRKDEELDVKMNPIEPFTYRKWRYMQPLQRRIG